MQYSFMEDLVTAVNQIEAVDWAFNQNGQDFAYNSLHSIRFALSHQKPTKNAPKPSGLNFPPILVDSEVC